MKDATIGVSAVILACLILALAAVGLVTIIAEVLKAMGTC